MENLAQIITNEIKDNFNHEHLGCKKDVVVEVKNKVVKVIDLIDSTDTCGDDFESEEDFEFDSDEWNEEREEYIEQEEVNQKEFFKDAKDFICRILKKHLGKDEADKYIIEL
jgi:hypothetical protein